MLYLENNNQRHFQALNSLCFHLKVLNSEQIQVAVSLNSCSSDALHLWRQSCLLLCSSDTQKCDAGILFQLYFNRWKYEGLLSGDFCVSRYPQKQSKCLQCKLPSLYSSVMQTPQGAAGPEYLPHPITPSHREYLRHSLPIMNSTGGQKLARTCLKLTPVLSILISEEPWIYYFWLCLTYVYLPSLQVLCLQDTSSLLCVLAGLAVSIYTEIHCLD